MSQTATSNLLRDIEIRQLVVPVAPGAPGWDDVVALSDQINRTQREVEGVHGLVRSPEQVLLAQQSQAHVEKVMWLASDGPTLVGSARFRRPLDDGSQESFVQIAVEPTHRRRGVASTLLGHVVEHSVAAGSSTLQTFVVHPADAQSPVLPAASGHGGVPLSNPSTQFLLHHGFTLEQASLGSLLRLPVDPAVLDAAEAEARTAATAYEVVTWEAPTPDHLLDDLAHLRRRMSTDAPNADRAASEEAWDAGRVRQHDAVEVAAGRRVLYAGARHRPSGRLVAFTELWVETDPRVVPDQLSTLVLREHRGHRLGLLVKVANLRQLAAARPDAPVLKTFNASENDHMLAINRRLGFEPSAVSGAWQKRLGA